MLDTLRKQETYLQMHRVFLHRVRYFFPDVYLKRHGDTIAVKIRQHRILSVSYQQFSDFCSQDRLSGCNAYSTGKLKHLKVNKGDISILGPTICTNVSFLKIFYTFKTIYIY